MPAQVGILPWEKKSTQIIILDISFQVDAKRIAVTDRIEDAVDYVVVGETIATYLANHRFNLIETLAEKLAAFLLEKFSLTGLRLSILKPKAITDATGVRVVVERNLCD